MKITAFACAFMLLIVSFASCSEKGGTAVMEYKDPNGKIVSGIDQSFLSLIIGIVNYQRGADSITDESIWDTKIDDGASTTVRELVIAEAAAYAKMLLQAEYLNDYVYGLGFSDEQQDALDSLVDSISVAMGGEKALETYLSTYGTNISSLRKFMLLQAKHYTLQTLLYTEGSGMEITDAEIKSFFAENYMIADYICILLTGGTKDDGTSIPLSEEEVAEKKTLANSLLNQLRSGAVEFETAMENYSDADYSSVYPEGYFIPVDGTAQGLDNLVSDAVRKMEIGEIRLVETSNAVYIVKRNPMNAELYNTKAGFAEGLGNALANEDFMKQLETADGVVVYEEAVNALNPAVIPSFNIDALLGA